jgi:hypothetical protein
MDYGDPSSAFFFTRQKKALPSGKSRQEEFVYHLFCATENR